MISVHPLGDYAHRQPLAYDPVRRACTEIVLRDSAGTADILLVAHSKDLDRHGAALRRGHLAGQRVVLLSEEPLWDTVWGADPMVREQVQETAEGAFPFTCLNHHTSTVYDFNRVPYFLLTAPAFLARYGRWFSRNAARSPAEWRTALDRAAHPAAFVAEYRDEARFDVDFPATGVFGLGALRTRIALACDGTRALRMGRGWNDLPARQDLPDWHLEKFLDLDGRCRCLSAIENTHQANYVTEKLFDAFAVGAVPLYIAGPGHRVGELVQEGAFLNLHGLSPEAAAAAIHDWTPGAGFAELYAATQARLATLFTDADAFAAEYRRLAGALTAELAAVMVG